MLWSTVGGWEWAVSTSPHRRAHIQTGAQWHAAMAYSDDYFNSAQQMLETLQQTLGYPDSRFPRYEAVGTYHSVMVIYQTLRSFFKAQDVPRVVSTLENDYELMRREMLDLSMSSNSLFGPTLFDENRRNVGRGAAGLVRGLFLVFT